MVKKQRRLWRTKSTNCTSAQCCHMFMGFFLLQRLESLLSYYYNKMYQHSEYICVFKKNNLFDLGHFFARQRIVHYSPMKWLWLTSPKVALVSHYYARFSSMKFLLSFTILTIYMRMICKFTRRPSLTFR